MELTRFDRHAGSGGPAARVLSASRPPLLLTALPSRFGACRNGIVPSLPCNPCGCVGSLRGFRHAPDFLLLRLAELLLQALQGHF